MNTIPDTDIPDKQQKKDRWHAGKPSKLLPLFAKHIIYLVIIAICCLFPFLSLSRKTVVIVGVIIIFLLIRFILRFVFSTIRYIIQWLILAAVILILLPIL